MREVGVQAPEQPAEPDENPELRQWIPAAVPTRNWVKRKSFLPDELLPPVFSAVTCTS